MVIPSNGGVGNLMLTGIKGNIRSLGYSAALHDEKVLQTWTLFGLIESWASKPSGGNKP